MNYSNGPWFTVQIREDFYQIRAYHQKNPITGERTQWVIALVGDWGTPLETTKDNAILIANAPEMFEALQTLKRAQKYTDAGMSTLALTNALSLCDAIEKLMGVTK